MKTRHAALLLFLIAAMPFAAAQQVGDTVRLTRDGANNYQLYAEATGDARAPGNDNVGGFGFNRRAVVVSLPVSGRYQVRINDDEPLIGGITGWVDAVHVVATAVVTDSPQVTLTWRDNSNNESGFTIERVIEGAADWPVIATVGIDVTTYVDNGLTPGTTYCYRVRAFNAAGASDPSNTACATISVPLSSPIPPAELTAVETTP